MKTKTFIGSCVLFLFLLATLVNAQTSPPELIFYQGIARDASGNPLVNQPIGIQLKIHQGAFNGPVVFTETHAVTTNSLGLFSLQIGSTNSTAFQLILWNNGPYFLEVLMDPNGGSAYTSIGTQQLLSVPYALYSKSSYSSAIAFGSYTTQNAPPISISSNTSATSTTLTLTQGSNTSFLYKLISLHLHHLLLVSLLPHHLLSLFFHLRGMLLPFQPPRHRLHLLMELQKSQVLTLII